TVSGAWSATTLYCTPSATPSLTIGPGLKFIVTIGGQAGTLSAVLWTPIAVATVTGVSPYDGPTSGGLVTLSGTGFGANSADITAVKYGVSGSGVYTTACSGATWFATGPTITCTVGGGLSGNTAYVFLVTIGSQAMTIPNTAVTASYTTTAAA